MEKGLRDTMRQPRVNIVIVNYNSYSYTAACLSSLFKSTYDNYRILIVDNHSSDNSIEELSAWLDEQNLNYGICKPEEHEVTKQIEKPEVRVILIRNNRNSGFGAGNNRALKPLIKSSSEDYIWLLNPDTEVEPEVMNDLVLATGNGEKIITGNSIYEFINRDKIIYCGGFKVHKNYHGMTDIVDPKAIGHIDAIAGASLFTPATTFIDLGLFPEHYFMYWEETDFCTLAKKKGYTFKINHRSKIYDHVGATAKGNFLREYLYLLNGLRYHKKYNYWRIPFILLSTSIKLLKAMLIEDKIKRKALYYAHVDFFKLIWNGNINIKNRLNQNRIDAN